MFSRFWKLSSYIACFVALYFYVAQLYSYSNSIPNVEVSWKGVVLSIFSIFLVVGISALGAMIWRELLKDAGYRITWTASVRVYFISQFGKYVPGNFAHHLGRVMMAREMGLPIGIVLNSMILEMLWGIGVGIGLSLGALLFFFEGRELVLKIGITPPLLMFFFVLIWSLPWLVAWGINKFFPAVAKKVAGEAGVVMPQFKTAFKVAALFLCGFFAMGYIVKMQANLFFDVTNHVTLVEITCLFSLAWIVGYLVPGAPGGLGVREIMMVVLLSPVMGSAAAVGVGLTLRITTTIGDLISFLFGMLVKKTQKLADA